MIAQTRHSLSRNRKAQALMTRPAHWAAFLDGIKQGCFPRSPGFFHGSNRGLPSLVLRKPSADLADAPRASNVEVAELGDVPAVHKVRAAAGAEVPVLVDEAPAVAALGDEPAHMKADERDAGGQQRAFAIGSLPDRAIRSASSRCA